jgi:hypothetical protein
MEKRVQLSWCKNSGVLYHLNRLNFNKGLNFLLIVLLMVCRQRWMEKRVQLSWCKNSGVLYPLNRLNFNKGLNFSVCSTPLSRVPSSMLEFSTNGFVDGV